MPWLALIFIALPVSEIWLLIEVGRRLGGWETVGLVLVVSIAGASFARWRGIVMARRIQAEAAAGRAPTRQILEGALIAFAGILFLLPGFLSDALALLMLVPWTRRLFLRMAGALFARATAEGRAGIFMSFAGGMATGVKEASEIKDVPADDVQVRGTDRPSIRDSEP